MIQDILTYMAILLATGYTIFNFYRVITSAGKKNTACSGCAGCAFKNAKAFSHTPNRSLRIV